MNELNMTNHEKILYIMQMFHPRAMKLMRKQKNFLVVAEDEPYFERVYSTIRENELEKGTWSKEDERRYQESLKPMPTYTESIIIEFEEWYAEQEQIHEMYDASPKEVAELAFIAGLRYRTQDLT